MAKFSHIVLHNGKTHAVKRFHPWVFSGAVKSRIGHIQEGSIVEILSEGGEFLGLGHYGTGSISARVFSFTKVESIAELWKEKFRSAYALRQCTGIANSADTNAYRLINAEGDGMPGLIVDWYNGTAVIQCHSIGMNNEKANFVEALKEVYGDKLKAVYDKSTSTLHQKKESPESTDDSYLYGSDSEKVVLENGNKFLVDWVKGQKTGFFIDQRDNRSLLSHYAKGRSVLNTFCYSGGFSVYALRAGASVVHSVDSSAKAVEWMNENVKLNGLDGKHEAFAADVFDYFKTAGEYDVVILDPPAFAKGQSARHSAIKAYTRLNETALRKIKPGGILFTFSCSQVVDRDMFTGAVTAAAITTGRNIRILHHLTQPADHPVSIYNPEGLYLKGLVLYVE